MMTKTEWFNSFMQWCLGMFMLFSIAFTIISVLSWLMPDDPYITLSDAAKAYPAANVLKANKDMFVIITRSNATLTDSKLNEYISIKFEPVYQVITVTQSTEKALYSYLTPYYYSSTNLIDTNYFYSYLTNCTNALLTPTIHQ